MQEQKCVMIIDEAMPAGAAANAAAVLGITVGSRLPHIVGADVTDASGYLHLGIIEFPVPVLSASADVIRDIRRRLFEDEYSDITAVDFSELAQGCKTYGEFTEKISAVPEGSLKYLGVALCGGKKQINRLTGSLPLWR